MVVTNIVLYFKTECTDSKRNISNMSKYSVCICLDDDR